MTGHADSPGHSSRGGTWRIMRLGGTTCGKTGLRWGGRLTSSTSLHMLPTTNTAGDTSGLPRMFVVISDISTLKYTHATYHSGCCCSVYCNPYDPLRNPRSVLIHNFSSIPEENVDTYPEQWHSRLGKRVRSYRAQPGSFRVRPSPPPPRRCGIT